MKYNLEDPLQQADAYAYLTKLAEQKKVVEIKRKDAVRSLPQNAYLHLLIGAFAAHFGYTMNEAKEIYKQLNSDVYMYTKKGRTFVKSSTELTTAEMARSIDVFRLKSSEAGYELPLATDKEWLIQIENEIERSKGAFS